MDSRRSFLLKTAGIGLAGRLLAQEPSTQEPFNRIPASVWKNARQNGLVMIHRNTPAVLSSRTQIVTAVEPGQRLLVAGQVFAPDGRAPVAGITVYAYNTDAEGYYGPNRTEYPPRLYGWMKTDAAGRFELCTIHPGRYPGMRVASHIHFAFWGAGYPIQGAGEVQFAGDSYLTAEMLAQDAQLGPFHTIREIRNGRCGFQIRVQRQSDYVASGAAGEA
jgi:protocatechuate 3,4-dioxygenase beta subunit